VTLPPQTTQDFIELEERYGAHNYHPLDLVIKEAKGAWVTDVQGRRYLDCLSSYSALNQGHAHPRILQTLIEQAQRVTLTSRAFRNDQLPLFCQELCELVGMERVLPMNSGAEAVETAIKAARRWGYTKKGIPDGQAEIIVCANNFHGRTVTIISASTDPDYRDGFGPFTPGFVVVVRIRRGADDRDYAPHLRAAHRAHPGRSGRAHPAGGLPEAGVRALQRASGAAACR